VELGDESNIFMWSIDINNILKLCTIVI